jgi:hypothetical protein
MNKYYFLLCSLPSISIGTKPEISFLELENYLKWNLTEADKKILFSFRQYIDIKNLKNLWLEKKIDPRGNLDEKTFHEALLTEDFFPVYVFTYLKKHVSTEEKITYFPVLEIEFFHDQIENFQSPFLLSFFKLERESKLILTALRAKNLKRDITIELAGEDKKDPLVDSILRQKDESLYEPPKEYIQLYNIFLKYQSEPKALYKAFLEYCFQKYEYFSERGPFTIDQILGYLANLILVEDYYYLNQEKGNSIVDSLL